MPPTPPAPSPSSPSPAAPPTTPLAVVPDHPNADRARAPRAPARGDRVDVTFWCGLHAGPGVVLGPAADQLDDDAVRVALDAGPTVACQPGECAPAPVRPAAP